MVILYSLQWEESQYVGPIPVDLEFILKMKNLPCREV
jgi:hypothetical protein